MEKYCKKCNTIKSINNFALCKRDGYQSFCKQCKSDYQKQNKDKKLIWQRKYRENNRDFLRSKRIEYYYYNHDRELNYKKEYCKNNREKLRAAYAKRRSAKLKAIPKWADLSKIKEIYKNCPKGYHVDHIIPLQGKNVSGLHVEYNLQYLTPKENLSKGNKLK